MSVDLLLSAALIMYTIVYGVVLSVRKVWPVNRGAGLWGLGLAVIYTACGGFSAASGDPWWITSGLFLGAVAFTIFTMLAYFGPFED